MNLKILIGIPWNVDYISTKFSIALRNIEIPYENECIDFAGRTNPERANAICRHALANDFSHVMIIDTDQIAPKISFISLWNILEEYGHERTIAFGWAICKKGQFEGKPSIFRKSKKGFHSIDIQEDHRKPFEVDASGCPCLLFSTEVLRKLDPPFFADLHLIRQQDKQDAEWLFTDFAMSPDFLFSVRAKVAGVALICDPQLKLAHEKMITI